MNNLCFLKKFFFVKEIFFSFTKNFFFSSRKTIYSLISKNLTAWAFLLLRQILYNGDMHLPTAKANSKCCKKIVNKDLKFLVQWLNANRISLNVAKTEIVIFRRKKKHLDCDLNLKLCGKKLKPSNYVRYLCIYLDEYLNWSPHINHLNKKLVKANAMLCKLQHFVNVATTKSIYYAIVHSHLSYVCTAWDQNLNSKHRINLLQKKAMWIISFASFDAHT